MKTNFKLPLLILALVSWPGFARAQGTAFSYQGRLEDGGLPATGLYDFTFNMFDVDAAGVALTGPLPLNAVPVTNGLFNVILDFGPGIFTGPARWLEIAVRTNGVGAPDLLAPRTPLLPTPYSIFAGQAAGVVNGGVTVNQLNTGVPPAPGQFLSYNGGNFLWTDPGVAVGNVWSLNGSTAYYTAGGVGIGTNNVTAGVRFEVNGPARVAAGGNGGALSIGTPNGESGLGVVGVNRFDLRFNGSSVKLVAGPGVGPPPAEYGITVSTNGSVGIGTTSFTAGIRLDVIGGATVLRPGNGTVEFGSPNGELGMTIKPNAGNRADLRFDGVTLKLLATTGIAPPSSASGITINANSGNVGIGGSLYPVAKLEVVAQDALRLVGYQPFLSLVDANAGYAMGRIQGVNGEIVLEPDSFVNGSNPNSSVVIANSGNVSLRTLTIRGGADVAEPFELTTADIAKGSVVVIDDEQAGKLKLSTHAYDTQVAGIISGANGINPGISLYQQGALESGQNVALSGRVYVLADASSGAIKPGDLLTTSGTPGHAMKVTDHARAQGAILGKAMSGLKEGKGMVLVIVTLQ